LAKAIVLAGSSNKESLKKCSNALHESLIKIGNKCMVEYVVDALKESHEVDGIIVSGPRKYLEGILLENQGLQLVENGPTILQSLLNALELLEIKSDSKVLVVTADIPLITGEIIDSFLKNCDGEDADFVYPVISKDINQAKFPGVKRTYAKLKDGVYTGGNIFLINPQIIGYCAPKAEELVILRKSPLQLVNYIGVRYFFKYIFRSLSIKDVEQRISQLFNIKGRAIVVTYPEIGVDVDKLSDLELVEKILG